MRNLKKHLERIYRKVALKLVERSNAESSNDSATSGNGSEALAGSTAADGSPEVATANGHVEAAVSEGAPASSTDFLSRAADS